MLCTGKDHMNTELLRVALAAPSGTGPGRVGSRAPALGLGLGPVHHELTMQVVGPSSVLSSGAQLRLPGGLACDLVRTL